MHTTPRAGRVTLALLAVTTTAATAPAAAVAPTVTPTPVARTAAITSGWSAERSVAAHPSTPVRSLAMAVNRARTANGRPPYRYDVQLSAVALRWARVLRASTTLRHNPRLSTEVSGWRKLGENVGYGPDPATAHRAFMASAPHRANILDRDYRQLGLAVVKDAHHRYWVVEVFRRPA